MRHVVVGVLALSLTTSFACSKQSESDLDASNQFNGQKVGHWYETFTLDDSLDNSFIMFHKQNKDLLLGNRNDFLPETLKGLWFMDGNPVGDQTFNLASAKPGRDANEDFYFEVNTPTTFSWTNIKANHDIIGLIAAVNLTYSFKFHDCPPDVKLEREQKYGMEDGSCTATDREFAVITPVIRGPLGEIRAPRSISYFDMYLRPKTSDFLVWERRSKVFEVGEQIVNTISAIFRQATKAQDFHRYNFTQVLDKEGAPLSSLPSLVKNVKGIAEKNGNALENFMFYVCYEGAEGCNRDSLSETDPVNIEPSRRIDFGALPVF
jgi:hypothetical protein